MHAFFLAKSRLAMAGKETVAANAKAIVLMFIKSLESKYITVG
jgi:hypothetical protein